MTTGLSINQLTAGYTGRPVLHDISLHVKPGETMAFVGQKPWHGVGNKLAPHQPIEVWRQQAGMDWQIEEAEVRYVTGSQNIGTINAFPQNKVLYRSDTKKPLAVVSRRSCRRFNSTRICTRAERAMTRLLGGSCRVPIAAYATLKGDKLSLEGLVGDAKTGKTVRGYASGPASEPEKLGEQVADMLVARGADALLP